jgi:Domain of unknown function (DUF4265)
MAQLDKVWFKVQQDEDGYPPVEVESLWAMPFDEGKYVLDNIPFFARGVSLRDMISVNQGADGHQWFCGVLNPSGHSTIRIVVFHNSSDPRPLEERVAELRARFTELGCSTELSYLVGLFAVDVPPSVLFSQVRPLLEEGRQLDRWDYEEANIRHTV